MSTALSDRRTVEAQAAAVRGLYAAYVATSNPAYVTAADLAYSVLVEQYYRPDQGVFATRLHSHKAKYDAPATGGASFSWSGKPIFS